MRTLHQLCLLSAAVLLSSAQLTFAAPPEKGMKVGGTEQRPSTIDESARASMGEIPASVERDKLTLATKAYKAILKTDQGEVPRSVLDKARCIAVFPSIMSGAALIGGSHGSGIASCRTANKQWSKPAFLTMTSASVGLQLGAKSSDLVLYLISDKAESGLKNGKITLGSDASVAAGNYSTAWNSGEANIVAYERSEGGMMGVSFNGYTLNKSDEMNKNYYGKHVDFVALLENRVEVAGDPSITSFISELPSSRL